MKNPLSYSGLWRGGNDEEARPLVAVSQRFAEELPYRNHEFASRAWGHKLHSLCSYQGKFKPSMAHWIVKAFSNPGDTVIDPLGGVGTVALEACLQGRLGVSSDLSPLAAVVAQAKVSAPHSTEVLAALADLAKGIRGGVPTENERRAATFGLNSPVNAYYHPQTLDEILLARRYYLDKVRLSNSEAFVKACLLHILHGNRPYALSRTSHPITPFRPTGDYEYRSVIDRLEARLMSVLAVGLPAIFTKGLAFEAHFRELPQAVARKANLVVTSPPFIGMRFDRPNWLRLWFCGWMEEDFHIRSRAFIDRQQCRRNLSVYAEFFRSCRELVTDTGTLVVHLGGSHTYDMATPLLSLAEADFSLVDKIVEDVSGVEKHGVLDKGTTSEHVLLVLTPR